MVRTLVVLLLLAGCSEDRIGRDLGARCIDNMDCDERCIPDPEFPGGMCTRDCLDDRDCPPDAVCVTTSRGDVCLFSCLDDRDCEFLGENAGRRWTCRVLPTTTELACVGEP